MSQTLACEYTAKLRAEMDTLIEHLRADLTKVEDPKAQALLENSADSVRALKTALEQYEQEVEAAIRHAKAAL